MEIQKKSEMKKEKEKENQKEGDKKKGLPSPSFQVDRTTAVSAVRGFKI